MRQKMQVIVALLVLIGGASGARGADTQGLERVLDQWASAWSSSDVEKLLPLFTDNRAISYDLIERCPLGLG